MCVHVCILYLAVCVLQTGNGLCVVFKDHPPEVCHGAAEWGLAHDELLAAVMPLFKQKRGGGKQHPVFHLHDKRAVS